MSSKSHFRVLLTTKQKQLLETQKSARRARQYSTTRAQLNLNLNRNNGYVNFATLLTLSIWSTRRFLNRMLSATSLRLLHRLKTKRWLDRISPLFSVSTSLAPCVSPNQSKASLKSKAIEDKLKLMRLHSSAITAINICRKAIKALLMSLDSNAFKLQFKAKLNKCHLAPPIVKQELLLLTVTSRLLVMDLSLLK